MYNAKGDDGGELRVSFVSSHPHVAMWITERSRSKGERESAGAKANASPVR
jgi:hypothetical protein